MVGKQGDEAMAGRTTHGGGWHRSPWRIATWALAALILLLPLIVMQFSDEMNWGVVDFVFAAVLILGTTLVFDLLMRMTNNTTYRVAVAVALAAAFMLIWGNLAVGLIGSEDEPANLMYFGVVAVGVIGAFIARFQPQGMARALFATALAQVLVAVIALIAGLGAPASGPLEILGLTGFFATLFAGSGLLFRKAAQEGSGQEVA
jgi:hypothetical protein